VMIGRGDRVDDLILIRKGECNLYGFVDSVEEKNCKDKILVVKLPKYSWYGDFQICYNLRSSF